MSVKYEPVKKHYKHPIYIVKGKYGPHVAKVYCKLCNEFIKWASKSELQIYEELNK
jgi:uncharacterized protein YwgA